MLVPKSSDSRDTQRFTHFKIAKNTSSTYYHPSPWVFTFWKLGYYCCLEWPKKNMNQLTIFEFKQAKEQGGKQKDKREKKGNPTGYSMRYHLVSNNKTNKKSHRIFNELFHSSQLWALLCCANCTRVWPNFSCVQIIRIWKWKLKDFINSELDCHCRCHCMTIGW